MKETTVILLGKCIQGKLLIRATIAVVDYLTDRTACEQYGSTDDHSQKMWDSEKFTLLVTCLHIYVP